jgi:F-type H+-transporting ATPase subunit gamma
MASRQQIKRRIGSVRNTRQITRAMQLMSASKLKRAQDAVLGPRDYSAVAREMLTQLRRLSQYDQASDLFTEREIKNRLIIVITSNQGLAGAYDPNVIRRLLQELTADRTSGVASSVIPIGRKGAQAISRVQGVRIAAVYNDLDDLTLEYNNARQAAITQELAEISGGAEALNG